MANYSNILLSSIIILFVLLLFCTQSQTQATTISVKEQEALNYVHDINQEKDKYEGVGAIPEPPPAQYGYAATDLPIVYFLYNMTTVGTDVLVVFNKFATGQLPTKSSNLAATNDSDSSWLRDKTEYCGASGVSGEIRSCVDSMESMINFVTPIMGSNVTPMSTPSGKLQTYKVVGPVRTIRHEATPCHHKDAPAGAFYSCHFIPNSQVRLVPLLGADGSRLEALTVCHMDTSSWNPKGFILQLLKIKPGPPVCHFMSTDDLVWVRS